MKKWLFLTIPFGIYGLLLVALIRPDTVVSASDADLATKVPYAIAGIGVFFSLIFGQYRLSLTSLFIAVASYAFSRHASSSAEPAAALLIAVVGPLVILCLHHMADRGLTAPGGIARIAIVGIAAGILVLAPESRTAMEALPASFQTPVAAGVAPLSAVAGVIAVIGLLIPRRGRSPLTGPILCAAVLCMLTAGTCSAGPWTEGIEQTVFFVFLTGAALVVGWAVLEQSWRNGSMDELTELPNRRALTGHLGRLSGSYALAIVDIDHFKRVNDRYGHDVGDQVLRYVASRLSRSCAGTAYRYGGEEFVLVMRCRDLDRTADHLDELRKLVAERKFVLRGKDRPATKPGKSKSSKAKPKTAQSRGFKVAVSIGVACRNDKHSSPQEVLEAADKALYAAKKAGRNRVKKGA